MDSVEVATVIDQASTYLGDSAIANDYSTQAGFTLIVAIEVESAACGALESDPIDDEVAFSPPLATTCMPYGRVAASTK